MNKVRALLGARGNNVRAPLARPDKGGGARQHAWLMLALAVCGLASACSQYNTNLTIQTSTSAITFVSPSTALAGGQPFTLTVNGTGFVTGAIILWNVGPGQVPTQLVTTIVNYSKLTAQVPVALLKNAGTVQIAVQIPGSAVSGSSGTGATTTTEISNVVYFSINPAPGPAPTVTSVSTSQTLPLQPSTPYCSATGITIYVNGANFVNDSTVNGQAVGHSTVYWNGSARPTTFKTATQLTAAIPFTDTAFAGTAEVSVYNDIASSDPGTSNSVPFTMSAPTALAPPGVPALSQTSAAVGSPALSLTVTGSNILPCSVAQWVNNGNAPATLPTTYVAPAGGAASLNITLPATDLLAAGTAQIVVFNPGPGGGTSPGPTAGAPDGAPFRIVPPVITTVTGSSNSACSLSGLTLTVTGMNFSNSSVINWNNSPRPTTFFSPTQLTALITSADITFPVTEPITVNTGSAVSNSVNFLVAAPASLPAPAISSLLPVNATAGTAAITMSVTGSNFLPCSLVQWNGANLPTSYISATQQLTAVVPATDIRSVGSAQITVFNPTTGGGGGSSAAVAFPIVVPTVTSLSASTSTTSPSAAPSCGYSGFILTVTGTNFVNGLVVNWNGSPRPTAFVSATQLTATISAADTAFPGTANVTVSSSTVTSNSSTFTLAAPASLPAPTIALRSPFAPTSAVAGDPAFLLGVNGTGWVPCSVIEWNGSSRTTLVAGTTGATAVISAADIVSPGAIPITAVNPAPGGGTSNAPSFPIYATPGQSSGTASAAGDLATPYTSANARYSVFVLASTDGKTEIPGTTENVFVSDTCAGVATGCTPSITLESVSINSNPADGNSISPSISADGRYVTFISSATNLVASDTNGVADVFVRDTCAGVASGCTPSTQRVSISTGGVQANADSTSATINSDGRYITFRSSATNLVSGSSATSDLFLRDTCAGATVCTPSPTTQQLK